MDTRIKIKSAVVDEYNRIKREYPIINKKDPIQREQLLTLNELDLILKNEKDDITEELKKFLDKRSKRVDQTDAAPWIYLQSPANQLSENTAIKLLNPDNGHIPEKSLNNFKLAVLKLFIPNLKIPTHSVSNQPFVSLNRWEWVLNKEGYPIEIGHCLKYARKTGKFMVTSKVETSMDLDEVALVIRHSAEAKNFADSFYTSIASIKEDEKEEGDELSKVWNRMRDQFQENLEKALKRNDYVVKASYGEKGARLLALNCYNDFMDQFQLLTDWKDLLEGTDIKLLKDDCLKEKKDIEEITFQDLGTDEKQAKRLLFGLSEIYKRELQNRDNEHNGITLLGYGFGRPKSKGLRAVEIFQEFLRSDYSIRWFDAYLIDKGLEEYRSIFNSFWLNSKLIHLLNLAEKYGLQDLTIDIDQDKEKDIDTDIENPEADEFFEKAMASPIIQPTFTPTCPAEQDSKEQTSNEEASKDLTSKEQGSSEEVLTEQVSSEQESKEQDSNSKKPSSEFKKSNWNPYKVEKIEKKKDEFKYSSSDFPGLSLVSDFQRQNQRQNIELSVKDTSTVNRP